jgi:hypothetical protein
MDITINILKDLVSRKLHAAIVILVMEVGANVP